VNGRGPFGPASVAAFLATAFLAVLLLVPLAAILQRGLADAPFAALATVAGDPFFRERLGRTLAQATLSTVLTLASGLPAALVFARYRFPGKALLRAAFTVPFVMPTVVAGAAFLALLGPGGALGVALVPLLLWGLLERVGGALGPVVPAVAGAWVAAVGIMMAALAA
jgi:thiamine transport system permease protein